MPDSQQIKTQLDIQGAVLGPGDEGFEESLNSWSDTCYRRAAAVVRPTTANDLASTVQYAKNHSLDLAVRSGGHSTLATSSTAGGILIDLGKEMTRVIADPDTRTVTVQGGATWGDVRKEVGWHALAVNGGTVSMVGVGGLSLEDGYGYYAPQHGVTLDTILAAQVVTGTGEIMSASRDENPDLFWAVRGAAPTVGVVYELMLQAYAQPNPLWYGMRSYPARVVQRVVEALNAALVHPRGKAAAQCLLHLSPEDSRTPIVSTVLFFDGGKDEAQRHFAPLLGIECINNKMRMAPFSKINTVLDSFVPPGGWKDELGFQTTVPPRPAFAAKILDYIAARFTEEPDLAHSSVEIDFFDPTRICRVPVADAAFPTRVRLLHGTVMIQWTDASKDEQSLKLGKSIQMMAERELLRQGEEQCLTVSNFTGYNQETKLSPSEMFGQNARRLLDVKAKYDPANMFNKQNPIV
ncbi:FAD binding domain protein [Aspergillus carlsbadensis]|nr:FAD binding domain protein [Aspergillus carlsbadensis]